MKITNHAVQRYQERVECLPAPIVRARLREHRSAVKKAADFGCDTVICGDGIRLKLASTTVLTVIGKWEG